MAPRKKTVAQRRTENKQAWQRKLTSRGHRMKWKLLPKSWDEGPYYSGKCQNQYCPAEINVNEDSYFATGFGLGPQQGTRRRCRGGR